MILSKSHMAVTMRGYMDPKPFSQNVAGGKTWHFAELLQNNHPLLMLCLLAWSSPCTWLQLIGWEFHMSWWQSSTLAEDHLHPYKRKNLLHISWPFTLFLTYNYTFLTFPVCSSPVDAHKMEPFIPVIVTIKCGYQRASEPECATGIPIIFMYWKLLHWKLEHVTITPWHPCLLRNRVNDYSFVYRTHKNSRYA